MMYNIYQKKLNVLKKKMFYRERLVDEQTRDIAALR